MEWITANDVRGFVGNTKATDDAALALATEVARGKVEDLCGPIALTTITDELVEVAGADEVKLRFRVRELVGVAEDSGAVLPLSGWRASGQVLRRADRGRIWSDLLVTYTAGYFDPDVPGEKAPAWARSMALHIAQQHLRTQRRFANPQDQTPAGFLVPKVALEEGADYLLSPGGVA